jgi:hypothetical protein
MFKYLALLLIVSCGAPKEQPRIKDYPALRAQVERVEPLLAWTCDGMIPARKADFPCIKEGDGVSVLGRWIFDTGDKAKMPAILLSVGVDGKEPKRNPARQGIDESNSFSRDQLLGLLEASLSTGNRAGLLSVMRYVQATGHLCIGDDRCNLTDSTRLLVNEVLGKKPSKVERAKDELTIAGEAATVPPNYRAYLVARKLLLHYKLGTTKGYRHSAAVLRKRFPSSAFIQLVDALSSGKSLDPVAAEVTRCLEQWEGPANNWHGDDVNGCQKRSYGHHLVGMGYLLLNDRK